MTNTINPNALAARLRKVADLLDEAAPTPVTAWLSLDVSRYYSRLTEPERIAVVNALAEVLGMTAPTAKKVSASYWQHETELAGDGFRLEVVTETDPPAQRCACGAVCSHTSAGGAS
jgi:hypothetical protein